MKLNNGCNNKAKNTLDFTFISMLREVTAVLLGMVVNHVLMKESTLFPPGREGPGRGDFEMVTCVFFFALVWEMRKQSFHKNIQVYMLLQRV